MKIVVSNSGPIISFCRAGKLYILKEVLSEITIPQAVYFEVVDQGKGRPASDEVSKATWIKTRFIKSIKAKKSLPDTLCQGEKEAIILVE